MFARTFLRSSRFVQTAKYARPSSFVPTVTSNALRTYSTNEKSTQELNEMRKCIRFEDELNLSEELCSLRLPPGIDAGLKRILVPMLQYAHEGGVIAEVRAQLAELSELLDDPSEYDVFLDALLYNPDSLDFLPPVRAAVDELNDLNQLKKIAELDEAFAFLYRQMSNERNVRVILPSEPSENEVDILENELKAFYFRDPSVDLDLDIRINPKIGTGRIYCFDEFMLDLTVDKIANELRDGLMVKEREYEAAIEDYDYVMSQPFNADLPVSNKNYMQSLNNYTNKVFVACGFLPAPR